MTDRFYLSEVKVNPTNGRCRPVNAELDDGGTVSYSHKKPTALTHKKVQTPSTENDSHNKSPIEMPTK